MIGPVCNIRKLKRQNEYRFLFRTLKSTAGFSVVYINVSSNENHICSLLIGLALRARKLKK